MRFVSCLCVLLVAAVIVSTADARKTFSPRRKTGENNRRGGSTSNKQKPPPQPATPHKPDTTNTNFLKSARAGTSRGSVNKHQRPNPFNNPEAPEAPKHNVPQKNGPIGFDKLGNQGNQKPLGFDKVNSEAQKKHNVRSVPAYPAGPPAYPKSATNPGNHSASATNGPSPAYPGYGSSGAGTHTGSFELPPAYPGWPVNAPPVYSARNHNYGKTNPGYPNQQGDYINQHGGYNNQQGGYPNQPGGYLNQQSGYPNQHGGYLNQQGGYPNQQGGYFNQQGGYNNQQGGYPNQQSGYPNQQGGYTNLRGGYPNQQSGYPNPQGGYPNQQGAYPNQQGEYPIQQGGGYPNQHGGYPNQQAGFQQGSSPHRQGSFPSQSYPGQQNYGYQNSGGNFGNYPNQGNNQGFGSYPGYGNSHMGGYGQSYPGFGGNSYGGYLFGQLNSYGGSPFGSSGFGGNMFGTSGYGNPHYSSNNFGFSNNPELLGSKYSGGNNSVGYHKESHFGGLPIPTPFPIPIPLGGLGGFGDRSYNRRVLDTFVKDGNVSSTDNTTTNVYILSNSTVTPQYSTVNELDTLDELPCTNDQFIYDSLNVTVVTCTPVNCTEIKVFTTTNVSGEESTQSAGVKMCLEPKANFSSFGVNINPKVSEVHRFSVKVCKEGITVKEPGNVTQQDVTNVTVNVSDVTLNETEVSEGNTSTSQPTTQESVDTTTLSRPLDNSTVTSAALNSTSTSGTNSSIWETFDCSWIEMCLNTIEVQDRCATPDCPPTKTGSQPCVRIKMCKSPNTPISTFATLNTTTYLTDEFNNITSYNDVFNLTWISFIPPTLADNFSQNATDSGCQPPKLNLTPEVCAPGNSTESVGTASSTPNNSTVCIPPIILPEGGGSTEVNVISTEATSTTLVH